MRYLVSNTHGSPRGIHDAGGVVRVIKPGKSLEVDLTDDVAAEIISGRGYLKVSRQRVEIRDGHAASPPDPSGESEPAGADTAKPRGKRGKRGPASAR